MDDVDITPSAKIAWERRRELGFFQAWWQTLRDVLLDPKGFFTRMSPGEGIQGPLIFFLIMQVSAALVASLFQAAAGRVMAPPLLMMGIFFFLLTSLVVLFLLSSLMHAVVRVLGGAAGYWASVIVVAYALGAAALFLILPAVGGFLNMGWGAFMVTHGFMRVHKITAGRALAAYLAPGVVLLAVFLTVLGAMRRAGVTDATLGDDMAKSRLRALAQAAESYARAHDGRYPPGAQELALGTLCGQNAGGFVYRCELGTAGYKFEAAPVIEGRTGTTTITVTTGEVFDPGEDSD